MKQVFIGLFAADMILLSAAAALGWAGSGPRAFAHHFGLGLFAVLYTVLMHSIVYTYFIVSGKMVGELVERSGIGGGLTDSALKLKIKTFRYAFLAMVAVILTAIFGARVSAVAVGEADASAVSAARTLHMIVAIIAFLIQPPVAALEYRNIGLQAALTNEALAAHAKKRAAAAEEQRGQAGSVATAGSAGSAGGGDLAARCQK